MLHQINASSKRYGMEVNRDKTKSMLVSDKQYKLDIKIDNSTIEQVSKFQYLGVQVTSDNYSAVDIRYSLAQPRLLSKNLNLSGGAREYH